VSLLAFALPILPGQREKWNQLTDELTTTRRQQYVESRRRLGLHERTFLQETPMGDFVIITLEGDNPQRMLEWFGSDDPFARWMGQELMSVHGMDATRPLPESFLPQQVMDTGNEVSGDNLMANILPILPGKLQQWRGFTAEMTGPRWQEFVASRQKMGLRQCVFYQATPMGDLSIVVVKGKEPRNLGQWFASNDPLAEWAAQQLKDLTGVDLRQVWTQSGGSRLVADTERQVTTRAA
jgi:hypothetical protein